MGVVGWVEVSVEGAEVAGGFAGCGGVGAGEGFYFHDGWIVCGVVVVRFGWNVIRCCLLLFVCLFVVFG